jgi:hypothetical protein
MITWDYEGTNIMYLWGQKKGKYYVDMVQLPKDLFYKEIPVTLCNQKERVLETQHTDWLQQTQASMFS